MVDAREEVEAAKRFAKNKLKENLKKGRYEHNFNELDITDHNFFHLRTALDELEEDIPNLNIKLRTPEAYVTHITNA